MSIRSILVPLTSNTERESAALEAATALAIRLQAHIEALYLKESPASNFRSLSRVSPNGGNVANAYELIKQEIAADCDAVHRTYSTLCTRHGLRVVDDESTNAGACAVWREVERDHQRALAAKGQTADLIVVGRPDPRDDRNILDAVLRGTGRPVLLVPERGGRLPARIAVAWNGSVESARALSMALPFLESAETVTVLTAASDRTPAAVAETARIYLARHGIPAETRVFDKGINPPVGKALLEHCRQIGAEMLVMGAYSHSRAHELLLGGVTAHMIAHADRPVLMVH